MAKIKIICDRFLALVTCSILVLMTATGFWQIFSRYALNDASSFSEELLRYLLIWLSLLAGTYAYGKKEHVSIMLLVNKLPKALQHKLLLFVEVLIMLFGIIVMFLGGIRAVLITMNQISASMEFHVGYVYVVLPLSGMLISLYSLLNIVELSSNKANNKEVGTEKGTEESSSYKTTI